MSHDDRNIFEKVRWKKLLIKIFLQSYSQIIGMRLPTIKHIFKKISKLNIKVGNLVP